MIARSSADAALPVRLADDAEGAPAERSHEKSQSSLLNEAEASARDATWAALRPSKLSSRDLSSSPGPASLASSEGLPTTCTVALANEEPLVSRVSVPEGGSPVEVSIHEL